MLEFGSSRSWKKRDYLTSFRVSDRNVLDQLFTKKRVGIYSGVDPTGPSLHVGHMLPFMVIGWAYIHGYKAVYLVSSIE